MVLSVSRHLSGDSTNQSNTPGSSSIPLVLHCLSDYRTKTRVIVNTTVKTSWLQTATSLQSSLYAPTQTIKGHHDADCQPRCPSDHETALFNVSEPTNATTYPDNIAPLQQKQLLPTTCSIAACHLQSEDRDQCGCMSSCFRFCGAQAVVLVGSRWLGVKGNVLHDPRVLPNHPSH